MVRLLTAAFLVSALCPCPAAVALPPGPAAEWVWTANARIPRGQAADFRREFNVGEGVAAAELRAAAEFCGLEVFLNGQSVGAVENYGPALRRDVGGLIREGRNVLSARGAGADGPAAVAVSLELTYGDGRRQHVATDGAWEATTSTGGRRPIPDAADAGRWSAATTLGIVESVAWSDPDVDAAVSELDDYTQWKRAIGGEAGTDPATFRVPPGFEIERLRSAAADEGSWVSLAVDPRGRVVIAREDRGLLRATLPKDGGAAGVETIEDSLQECRGLLFAHGALYVNANNSKALYRLRDSDGDDRYDEVTRLYESGGGVGHGRNDLALGPDGRVYSIHGDSVYLPRDFADRTSPFREHRRGEKTSEGHLLRFGADGRDGEIVAAGLRNPFGVDFDEDGEAFTYDADAEYDMGTPWYRPTRVVHLVSGADYGWRGVTGRWPPFYPDRPDNAPPTLDIGKGSPTAVRFGARSDFPPEYRRALFALDWAYGRILAVRFIPRGASYAARAETFLKGHPLNVTDLDFGPDGAMYFVTGGRKTQSALYRVRHVGPAVAETTATARQIARAEFSSKARALRRRLEAFHGARDPRAVDAAWEHLGSADPWIRHAARIAVEHQPLEGWRERVFSEPDPGAAVTALLALARGGEAGLVPRVLSRLDELPLADLPESGQLAALRVYSLCLADPTSVDDALRAAVVGQLGSLFPSASAAVNQELSRLLIALDAAAAVPRTVELLRTATDQRQRVHYLFVLRDAQAGWTPDLRRSYFLSLRQMRDFPGGEGMPKFVQQLEADALAALGDAERAEYEPLLAGDAAGTAPPVEARPFVREWALADLEDALAHAGHGRDFGRGKAMFTAAACDRCHRVGESGAAVGPDLTSVGSRFSRRDVLRSILTPSEVVAEQYRRAQIVTKDGRVLTGQIVPGRDYRSPMLRIATDPLRPDGVVEVAKSDVESHTTSQTSIMPAGLLNTLTEEEILDLLAWLEAGGNPQHPAFRR